MTIEVVRTMLMLMLMFLPLFAVLFLLLPYPRPLLFLCLCPYRHTTVPRPPSRPLNKERDTRAPVGVPERRRRRRGGHHRD